MNLAIFGLAFGLLSQPTAIPSEADRTQARALFEEAALAKKQGRWQDVRRLLEESLALYPQFASAWNLVTAAEQLDDLPAAEHWLLALEAGRYGPLAEKERASVLERRVAVQKELGTILLEVGRAGAKVTVDGRERGAVDVQGNLRLRVSAGTHVVAATSEDGRTLSRSIDVERGGQRSLRFSFVEDADRGRLRVELADPAEAVSLDGVAQRAGDLDLSLPPRTYQVGLLGEEPRAVTVVAGQTERVRLERSSGSSPWLWITLGALVAVGAAVTVAVVLSGPADPLPADFMAPPL